MNIYIYIYIYIYLSLSLCVHNHTLAREDPSDVGSRSVCVCVHTRRRFFTASAMNPGKSRAKTLCTLYLGFLGFGFSLGFRVPT